MTLKVAVSGVNLHGYSARKVLTDIGLSGGWTFSNDAAQISAFELTVLFQFTMSMCLLVPV